MVFSFLDKNLVSNQQVLIKLRNNSRFICRIKKYDKHFNLIVYDCVIHKNLKSLNKGVKKRDIGYSTELILENKEVYIRGDSVIYISEVSKLIYKKRL